MPRANRYFLPGHVWHITHRCHNKEFLLKFAKDRKRWLHWLFAEQYGVRPYNLHSWPIQAAVLIGCKM